MKQSYVGLVCELKEFAKNHFIDAPYGYPFSNEYFFDGKKMRFPNYTNRVFFFIRSTGVER